MSTRDDYAGVVILGAGLAGLGCARRLPGARVFEAQSAPGGHAMSHRLGPCSFDQGAHICHTKDEAFRAQIFAGTEVSHIEHSEVASWYHGQWVTYPVQNHLHELPAGARTRALVDFVRAQVARHDDRAGEDYQSWCRAQYGDYLTDEFYALYTDKYWRVPMAELSTDWLGGRLVPSQVDRVIAGAIAAQSELQTTFARFHYPASGGFFAFFEPLYRELIAGGRVELVCDERVVSIDPARRSIRFASGRNERYERLVSSIPLPGLVAMAADAPGAVRDAARRLRHTQLLCVNLIVDGAQRSPHDWFYIYDRDIDAARVSAPLRLAQRAEARPFTALQAEIFHRDDEPFAAHDDLAERTTAALARLLGFSAGDVMHVEARHEPYAYVISDHQRQSAVDQISAWLEQQAIFPTGLYGKWRFIWSDAAFRDGEATADAVRASYDE